MSLVQAIERGQHAALAVAIDGAPFECEVPSLQIGIAERVRRMQNADQQIIETGIEFAAPASESEIIEQEAIVRGQRHRPGIAQPGVVVGRVNKLQLR